MAPKRPPRAAQATPNAQTATTSVRAVYVYDVLTDSQLTSCAGETVAAATADIAPYSHPSSAAYLHAPDADSRTEPAHLFVASATTAPARPTATYPTAPARRGVPSSRAGISQRILPEETALLRFDWPGRASACPALTNRRCVPCRAPVGHGGGCRSFHTTTPTRRTVTTRRTNTVCTIRNTPVQCEPWRGKTGRRV